MDFLVYILFYFYYRVNVMDKEKQLQFCFAIFTAYYSLFPQFIASFLEAAVN